VPGLNRNDDAFDPQIPHYAISPPHFAWRAWLSTVGVDHPSLFFARIAVKRHAAVLPEQQRRRWWLPGKGPYQLLL